jgi:hypothetical protein
MECTAAVLIRSQVYQSVLFVTTGNQIRSLYLEILHEVWPKAVRDLTICNASRVITWSDYV